MQGFIRQTLSALAQEVPINLHWEGVLPQTPITGVTYNSREVQSGSLFVAILGTKIDGHEFITDAIERGAAAIVGSRDMQGLPVPYLRTAETREALAYFSAAFYNNPARQMTVCGVTGTDGKTTTSNLIYQILLANGTPAGIISTVNAVIGDEVLDTGFHVTTPEAPEVQRYLARMRASGLSHVVLESTSHGLQQHRVTGCEFDIGVVTNITHEHLDYHGSYEAYRAAKGRLFSMLSQTVKKEGGIPAMAVLNRDDSSYEFLDGITAVSKVSYGLHPGSMVTAQNIRYEPDSLRFNIVGPGIRQEVTSTLVGPFNVANILAAFSATAIGLGISPETAAKGIADLRGIPGRMERIHMGQEFQALVDFAHTPNALYQALLAIRPMVSGRVIAVFGSAGLRDREKRRLMAEVSADFADISIFTAEDPRTESLDDILAEMSAGAIHKGGREGHTFFRIRDRGEAITQAINMAGPGDLVIACGKGHEQSMCFGETEYHWDDRTAMRAALAKLQQVSGPSMPFLPTQDDRSK